MISKIIEMSYIHGSREIRKELEGYVNSSEGFLFFLSWMIVTSFYMLQGMSQKIRKI